MLPSFPTGQILLTRTCNHVWLPQGIQREILPDGIPKYKNTVQHVKVLARKVVGHLSTRYKSKDCMAVKNYLTEGPLILLSLPSISF